MNDISRHIDPGLIDRFAAIVGDKYALRDQQDIAPYLTERRGLWHGRTALVLRPGSVDEVSRIMQLATETGTPVVPQSGNTGLVGAQVPDTSGRQIVLSLSRLNRIREVDVLSNTVTVEAGVILQTLQEAADAADRLFPLSLAAQGSCQIGGNLSSNAGGTGVLAYGNARELCLGVEVVLPTGEVFDDLRKLKKDNTGYDLKNLFIGAEGTLGVITAAVLKLFPKPKGREVAFAGLSSPEAALSLLSLAMDHAGAALTAFELIGQRPYDFTLLHAPGVVRPLSGDWPWYVLMQISSGRSAEDAQGPHRGGALSRPRAGDRRRCSDCGEHRAGRCLLEFPRAAARGAEARRRLDQARHLCAGGGHPANSSKRRPAPFNRSAPVRARCVSATWATAISTTTSRGRSAAMTKRFSGSITP